MRRKKRHGAEDPDRRGKSVRAAEGGWLFSFFFFFSSFPFVLGDHFPAAVIVASSLACSFVFTSLLHDDLLRVLFVLLFFSLCLTLLFHCRTSSPFFLSFLLLLLLVLFHSPIFLYAPRTHSAQEIRPCGVSPDPNTDPTGAPSALFPFSPAPLVCVDDCSRGPLLESWMTFAYFHWMLHTAMPSQVLGA
ncbi:hypothetical protein IWX50DRAFT_33964 [Phyllosticta citricarpa]